MVALGIITSIIALFLLYACIMLLWRADADTIAEHDAIIVLTGDKGRIEYGFQLLLAGKADRLLISGVVNNLSKDIIIDQNSSSISQSDINRLKNHCCIELDYVADSTVTNALETNKWITDNDIESIILVTSYYHMPRSYYLFHRALDDAIRVTAAPYREEERLLNMITSKSFWYRAKDEFIKFGGSLIRMEYQK